ncbi:site-specific integrase [Aquimarina algiphila]|uniref:site-specific integrase n=1 Tax=Aquimarina algiphila TaxID=2047982 RepID=UPI00249010D9|nr:site-specific integrase [Aquimarina algiphila]
MQVSFHLRKDKIGKVGLAPIRMVIATNGFKIFKAVKGVKCSENNWDSRKERIKAQKRKEEYNNYIEYNKIIDELEANIKKLDRYILLNNIVPTKEYILEKLASGIEKVELTHFFFPSFEEFIEISKSVKVPRTIKSYVTTRNFLQDFEASTGYKLTFDSIDNNFFEKIQDYTFLNRKNKNSYLAFIIKVLNTFMRWSYEKEYHDNLKFKKFKVRIDETEIIYLTMDELMTLYNHEFDSNRLSQVRDVYCFNCFTGLRISDTSSLKPSNISDEAITLTIQKTRANNTRIPLNRFSKAILEKYKDTIYEPLPIISQQKFNKYIKECCEKTKINTPITITRYIGQKRIDKTVPKHDLITSHTARKTFVTNSLVLGMKEIVVRNITGHKKEESFRRYVKIAEDLKRQEMDNTWDKIK